MSNHDEYNFCVIKTVLCGGAKQLKKDFHFHTILLETYVMPAKWGFSFSVSGSSWAKKTVNVRQTV